LDAARGFTSFSTPKNSNCMKYGELALVDLVGEESGGVNFCAFEDDKRPNVLNE
jgi:hypothetical protein